MKKLNPINYKLLRRKLNPNQLAFKNTAELKPLTEFVGQERALEAIFFGIGIKNVGYNLYAMGPSGIGKRSLIRNVLEAQAKQKPTPSDWCYLYNFDAPEKPISLALPCGLGTILQQDMKSFITEISTSILAMFESDEYRDGMQKINDEFNKKKELSTDNSQTLKIPKLYKERHKNEKELQLKFSSGVIEPIIQKLEKKYHGFSQIIYYLSAVKKDIIENANELVQEDEKTEILFFPLDNPILIRYQINLLVDNEKTAGAPVIFEENPSYSNLICRVEHISLHGNLTTNFMLIKPGALHRANGGYLIIEARKLKSNKKAWEGLKRALYARNIVIEPEEHLSESARTISLEPMSIPLEIKIILLGDRTTYYSLSNNDADFGELFKVAVDFDEQIERNKKNINLYARLIGTICQRENVRPINTAGVAAIIDYSTRLAEDIDKLSTHVRNIDDLILESDYWAGLANKKIIDMGDVKKAIATQIHRLDRTRELYYEEIDRNFIFINTQGHAIGEVNCLSVVKVGKFSYGHPTRVTARVRMGKGKIIDIQHQIKLAGPIHAKAALTISNFLASRYVLDYYFSLSASLSFEQIYGGVEGDSASVAELCALLSALAGIPIKQHLAVTGSINQEGEVQVIGGVNQKIEGFYDICQMRGLTGEQGVLIPSMNIKNLMLREDIVAAAKAKKFFIYTIDTIDQAITLLTGITAGTRGKKGTFTRNSVNEKVERRLQTYANIRKKSQNNC